MIKGIVISFMLGILAITNVAGQDLHFTQYRTAPLSLNPAMAGFLDGNLRMSGNYRNQWFSVSSFSTYAFAMDANIARTKMKYNMLGVGLSFFQDIEEKNGYTNTNISLTTAYNIKLTQHPLQYLGFGVQPSLIRKQINLMDAVYGTLFETGVNTDPLGFDEYGGFKFDLNLGLSYYIFFSSKHILTTGFSLSHVTQPELGRLATDELYRKYAVYFFLEMEAGRTGLSWLTPSFYFAKQGPSIEFLPGLSARFRFFNATNDIYLGFGAATRLVGHNTSNLSSSDFIASTQLIIENFTVGFSYDVAISDLKEATGRNGGPEVSLIVDLNFQRRIHPSYFRMMKY